MMPSLPQCALNKAKSGIRCSILLNTNILLVDALLNIYVRPDLTNAITNVKTLLSINTWEQLT